MKPQQDKPKRIIWATPFTKFLSLGMNERKLVPSAQVVYKNPPTLKQILTNYRQIAHNTSIDSIQPGSSKPCYRCSLCGKHGNNRSMVRPTSSITLFQNKKITLIQNLTCANYGIYAAQCKLCNEFYVGQTKNKFSVRWSSHRTFWKTKNTANNTDKAALLLHFHNHHNQFLSSSPEISSCYDVIFLQEPDSYNNLDFYESKWVNTLKATINTNKTLLPRFY